MGTVRPLRMIFINGPLHRQAIDMTWIPEVNLVSNSREKIVYAYIRDEMVYFYDPGLSAKLTAMYDQVQGHFKKNPVNPVGEIP